MLEKNKMDEKILFTDFVMKINRKGKQQQRTLLITDKAVYNLKDKKMKRRIDIQSITAITASQVSDEFVLHMPEEVTPSRPPQAHTHTRTARERPFCSPLPRCVARPEFPPRSFCPTSTTTATSRPKRQRSCRS